MKVLINPTIKINKAVKNKCFEYSITLDKKQPNHLLIKARSSDGRGRGVVGKVLRDGTIEIQREGVKIRPLLSKTIQEKISLTLDLVFGFKRDRDCILTNKGLVQFN